MHGRRGVPEKSKDFSGSMKRLFKSLDKWKYFIMIAMILSVGSAILGLVTPNRLRDLTDVMTEGIKPNISEKSIQEIMTSKDISAKDKQKFTIIMSSMQKDKDTSKALKNIDRLPKSIYNKIKPEIDMRRVKKLSLFILILLVTSSLFNYIQGLIMTITSNKF